MATEKQTRRDITSKGEIVKCTLALLALIGVPNGLAYVSEDQRLSANPNASEEAARQVDGFKKLPLNAKIITLGEYLASLKHDTRTDTQRTLAQNETE